MQSSIRLIAFLLILFCYSQPFSQGMMVSGELTDSDGNLIGSQTPFLTDVVIRLYDTAQAGTALYSETFLITDNQGISVTKGIFSVSLGQGTSSDDLAATIGSSNSLWIEVVIDGDVLSRAPVTGSAYVIPSPTQLQAQMNN